MKAGFIVGFSDSTSTPPDSYWDGVAIVPEVDNAQFFSEVSFARAVSGPLQGTHTDQHVEVYSVTKTIAHNPALGSAGI